MPKRPPPVIVKVKGPKPESFGVLLRRAREARGLGLSELARASGIDKTYLSRLENGERRLLFKYLSSLTDSLGFDAKVTEELRGLLRAAIAEMKGQNDATFNSLINTLYQQGTCEQAEDALKQIGITNPANLQRLFITSGAAAPDHVREALRNKFVAVDIHRPDGTTMRIIAEDRLPKGKKK